MNEEYLELQQLLQSMDVNFSNDFDKIIRDRLLVGMDFRFDGTTKIKIYPCIHPNELSCFSFSPQVEKVLRKVSKINMTYN